jgi:hypothetical protein
MFWAQATSRENASVTTAQLTSVDYGDECAICNAATLEHARRRIRGTALTALLAPRHHDPQTPHDQSFNPLRWLRGLRLFLPAATVTDRALFRCNAMLILTLTWYVT